MFNDLLEYICKKKVYAEIKGMTSAGTEKILTQSSALPGAFLQGKTTVFYSHMVSTILFHEKGCTIVLKH